MRHGKYKIVMGIPGRGDWYGPDPSRAWPVNYIMGPDATDYAFVDKVGDGGQRAFRDRHAATGEYDGSLLKTLW